MVEQNTIAERGKATQFRTGAQQVEVARKGGKASGVRRRFAKTIMEAVDAQLERKSKDGSSNGFEAIGAALMAKAVRGDIQAARLILELKGELNKPQKVELSGNLATVERKELSVAEAKEMMSGMEKEYGLK